MIQLFSEFMHIYFWVYLLLLCLGGIDPTDADQIDKLVSRGSNFLGIVGLTLWLMSWHY